MIWRARTLPEARHGLEQVDDPHLADDVVRLALLEHLGDRGAGVLQAVLDLGPLPARRGGLLEGRLALFGGERGKCHRAPLHRGAGWRGVVSATLVSRRGRRQSGPIAAAGQPGGSRSSSLARRAAAPSAAGSGPWRSRSRLELGSTFAAADPKIRPRSAAVPPWAPYPGASSGPLIAKSSPESPMVAPTTAPNEPSGSAPALSGAQVVQHRAGDRAAVAGGRVLHLGALRVGGQREHEQAGAVASRGLDERVERAEAEVGADRDRVGGQRRGRVEVGVGVGLAGRADVAALDVQEHQGAGRPGLGDHPLQHRDAAAAEPLEERRLRLDHRDVRRQRLDRGQREPLQPGHGRRRGPTSCSSDGVRVDAGAERAARVHGRRAAVRRRSRSCGAPRSTAPAARAPADDPRAGQQRALVDEGGVALQQGRPRRRAGPGRPRRW